MSEDTNNNQEGVQFSDLTELYIDADDINNVKAFFEHFKISIPDYLAAANAAFEAEHRANPNNKERLTSLQNDFRAALCAAMVESEHPLFKDELFSVVRENAKQIAFLRHFNQQAADTLGIADLIK